MLAHAIGELKNLPLAVICIDRTAKPCYDYVQIENTEGARITRILGLGKVTLCTYAKLVQIYTRRPNSTNN